METAGVYFGPLKTFFLSAKLENIRIDTYLKILVIQNSKTQGESVFSCTCHVSQEQSKCHALCSNCSIFQTKHATELKTGQQIYLQNVFYPMKLKNFNFSFSDVT